MAQKNMIIALIISFLFTGLGIAYAGNIRKALTFFIIGVILNVLGVWVHMIFSLIGIVFWIYAMYATYQEVRMVNGYY
ncbi:hypothetical protein [Methanobrevibacter sp.]|uniref:hypothetical protein n=1 Tax=Methanobrevibacter sp. TaxID=66852 RepID=UPI00388DEA1C